MKRALHEYVILGVKTNIPFHLQLLDDPRFINGEVHTGFLDSEFKMNEPDGAASREEVALLVAAVMSHQRRQRNGAQPAIILAPDQWREQGRDRQIRSHSGMPQGARWRRNTG
jgi:acetyl/propionyl-CoA carboxylase alpha subunit